MKYTADIEIDGDRWANHPFSITIKDEDGNVEYRMDSLNSREICYKIADRYGIPHSDIKESFY